MSGALPSTLRAWGARATRASTGCHVASGDNARPLPNPLWCLRGLHPSSSVSSASGPAIASSQSRTRITTTGPHHPMSICISSLQSPTAPVVSALQRRSQGHARPDRGIVQKTPPAMHAAHQQSKQPFLSIYNLALVCAFLRMGSILVAFITSPLILSLPDMKRRCALALPVTRLWKSASERDSVTVPVSIGSTLEGGTKLTRGLVPEPLADLALVLEVNVPALGLAGGVLEGKGEHGVALLDGRLLLGGVAEGRVDGVKGGRRGELVCWRPS